MRAHAIACDRDSDLSADPDAFARASLGQASGIVRVGLLLDDADDLVGGQIGFGIAETNVSDGGITHGAIEVGGENFDPSSWVIRLMFVGRGLGAEFDEAELVSW